MSDHEPPHDDHDHPTTSCEGHDHPHAHDDHPHPHDPRPGEPCSGHGHHPHDHPHSHGSGETCEHHHYKPSVFVKSWSHVAGAMAGIAGLFALGLLALTRRLGTVRNPDGTENEEAKQRIEDVSYTINHAVACTATDVVDPFIGNATQKYLGKRISIGCGHDHSDHLKEWVVGETAGDLGAVLATVGLLRFAPGVMTGINALTAPLLEDFFRIGVRRATNEWAAQQGVARGSDEYKAHFKQLYDYELRHLPQAFTWTASSIAINIATQRMVGNMAPLWHIITGKAVGAGISASLLVAGRAVAPEAAHRWDKFTDEKLFTPTTRVLGNWLGLDAPVADGVIATQKNTGREMTAPLG